VANLDLAQVSAQITFSRSQSAAGFGTIKQGSVTTSSVPVITLGGTGLTDVFANQYSIGAGSTQTINLQALVDAFHTASPWTKLQYLLFQSIGTPGMPFTVEPGASNPFPILGGTTPTLPIDPNGFLMIGYGNTQTVSGSVKNIGLTNTGASTGLFNVCLLGGP
jgi:hypothetical protein